MGCYIMNAFCIGTSVCGGKLSTGMSGFNVFICSPVQNLLTRVEEAVDKFLYWDEEVTIIEAVTSVSLHILAN